MVCPTSFKGFFTLSVPELADGAVYTDDVKRMVFDAYYNDKLGGTMERTAEVIRRRYGWRLSKDFMLDAMRESQHMRVQSDGFDSELLRLPRFNPRIQAMATEAR